VGGRDHDAVAALIGFDADTVSLLVVDPDADSYFQQRRIEISGDMDPDCLERITCPDIKPQGLLFLCSCSNRYGERKCVEIF